MLFCNRTQTASRPVTGELTLAHTLTTSAPQRWAGLALTLLVLTSGALAALPNDRIGDQFVANGPDIEALTLERTSDALLVTLSLQGGFPPPAPDGSGVVGFIDFDADRDATSGQQSAVDFLGSNRTPQLRSLLGVEYQLVLSSWSIEDGSLDLVDQVTRQRVARVPAQFFGNALTITKSSDSALFWFFEENNWELLVKVLDGCAITNTFWVFSAATTNVEFTLTVSDTVTGAVRVYENPLGLAAPAINDVEAFASCGQ